MSVTPSNDTDTGSETVPWPQQLYDSIWLLAGAALLFFALSYIVWGLVDLMTIGMG